MNPQPAQTDRAPLTDEQRRVVDNAKRMGSRFPRSGPPANSPAWERETNKMVGREVTVTQYVGVGATGAPLFIDHVGICVAIQSAHLSVILMTETEKLIIKNVAAIRRVRARNNPPKSPQEALGEVLSDALKGAPE